MKNIINFRRNILLLKIYFEELKTLNIEQVPKYSSIVQVFGKLCLRFDKWIKIRKLNETYLG